MLVSKYTRIFMKFEQCVEVNIEISCREFGKYIFTETQDILMKIISLIKQISHSLMKIWLNYIALLIKNKYI